VKPQRSARVLARVLAALALAAGAALAGLALFGGEDSYRYRLAFETAGQLVEGNQVMVAGRPIGRIEEISLAPDGQAEVEITVDRPLRRGTTAQIRLSSLSGVANRYIALHLGPDNAPELPRDETLSLDATTAPVDLDQFLNTFDRRTRAALQDVIGGLATVYAGREREARRTYKYFAPSLQAGERLLAQLNRDQAALSRFLVSGGNVFAALASRREELSELTQNANEALGAIAAENAEFDRALAELPPALRQANTTFVNLRAALDDLDPLVGDLGRAAPHLPRLLRDLRPVARRAVPVFRDLRLAIARDGARNDLTEALRALPGARRSARTAVPRAIRGLDDSQHLFEFARSYAPDLVAVLAKLGAGAGYYDRNGHYLRVQAAGSNPFARDPGSGELEPIGVDQILDAYGPLGLGPFTRCPGGATQPNAGWPAPEDHPFLADGQLAGDCDPSDVPPGP